MKRWIYIAVTDTLIVLGAILLITIGSQWELDRAYEAWIGTDPIVLRNEWGQLRHTPEFMCEATIRQWMEACK